MKHEMTLTEIRQTGIELLTNHLGIEGMVRFFQQTETGTGNYTEERKQWLINSDVRSLANEIIKQRHKKDNKKQTGRIGEKTMKKQPLKIGI